MKTQKQQILDHIKEHGKITTIEAAYKYRITRLSARIYELRHDDGIPIDSKRIVKKQEGRTVQYDEYYLRESA